MLVINGKKFHGELSYSKINPIFIEIMKLPPPELHSPFQSSHIQSEETVLCLQGEVAHVSLDASNPYNNPVKYLGSKEVYSCVQVFVHTDRDYLTIHFDSRVSGHPLIF